MSPLDPLCEGIAAVVYESLVEICGGDENDVSSCIIRQELHLLSSSTVTRVVNKPTAQDPQGIEGKPWNVEVRVAPALYHRWRGKNKKRDGSENCLRITSDMGVSRSIHSPAQLGQLLVTRVEDGCRHAGISHNVRCNLSGFLCIVTPDRVETLRQAGRLSCPHCVHWCKGEKGLWWHCQQQHAVEHSVATTVAISQRNTLAMVPYCEYVSPILRVGPANTVVASSQSSLIPTIFDNDTPLQAIQRGDLQSLKRHVDEHGYNPGTAMDNKGASPLLWAAGGGYLSIVQYLIDECHCDPNVRQQGKRAFKGRTPLHWAARKGHLEVVKYLVGACRVNVDAVTGDGTAAFCWASWQAHKSVMVFLKDSGCSVYSTNAYGCNAALWCAQGEGDECTMEWLQSVGCPMAVVNSNGHGVFHKAAQRGRRDICEWFCQELQDDCVANLRLIGPDSDGCTPSDLAGMEGHEELAVWVAEQETHLVALAAQEKGFEAPTWIMETPEGVAMLAPSNRLVWEPWAGLRRLRSIAAKDRAEERPWR